MRALLGTVAGVTRYRRLDAPVPVVVARAGLVPLPPASPYIGTHLVLDDDVPAEVAGSVQAWNRGADGWRALVLWRDPSGLNRLRWVGSRHLTEAAYV